MTDLRCHHGNFAAQVNVGRIVDDHDPNMLKRLTVEVMVQCTACGVALEFQGLPVGIDTHGPTVSPDGVEARLVAVPKGEVLLASGRVAAIFRSTEGRA